MHLEVEEGTGQIPKKPESITNSQSEFDDFPGTLGKQSPISELEKKESVQNTETNENRKTGSSFQREKRRIVHYGDPDYYKHLPPHLQYLIELPCADGSIGFYPPPYEIELEEDDEGMQLSSLPSEERGQASDVGG